MDSEIDRKIAEIRKKYQQYTKKTDNVQDRTDRLRLEKKYSNISTINESNENSDEYMELKMRKIGTNYEHSLKDIYLPPRTNNYLN